MKRMLILAAALTLAAAAPASADQTLTFNIVGAGRITGQGLDCTRATADGPQLGDCAERVFDGPIECSELFCIPTPGTLTFQAIPGNGFRFASWSHPQCPNARNPCTVAVAIGSGIPDLNVTATFQDVQPPAVSVTSPANGAVIHGRTRLSATAADNGGVKQVVFRVRGNPFQTFEVPPYTFNFDTLVLDDGPATISATATDGSGLSSSASVNVTIDNTAPTLKLSGPADGAVFTPGATASWGIGTEDATGTPSVQCSVVTQGLPPAFGPCTSSTEETLPNLRSGRFTLTVRATDGAGNTAQEARSFSVGLTPIPMPCTPKLCHGHG
jgi:Big-like domain-containing protein